MIGLAPATNVHGFRARRRGIAARVHRFRRPETTTLGRH